MLDHLADLESDFSAIHRIDNIYALDAPTFFARAHRIGAYQGVIRLRSEAAALQSAQARQADQPAGVATIPADRDTLATHPALAGSGQFAALFEVATGGEV